MGISPRSSRSLILLAARGAHVQQGDIGRDPLALARPVEGPGEVPEPSEGRNEAMNPL